MSDRVPAELLEIADALLPGVSLDDARLAAHGNIHHVILLPGIAAVRISRRPSAAEALPRRMEALRLIAASGLPFAVPEPLTPVTTFGDRAAAAVSWLAGAGWPEGHGDPARIGELLAALRDLPLTPELTLALGGAPYAYADASSRPPWARILAEDVIPRLPPKWRADGRRRLEAALALESVPPSLVHGDLVGVNVHWSPDGKLIGVLDWDLARLFDPALDAAFMAWHGWHNLRAAVDSHTYRRARVWNALFGVEHLIAVLDGKPLTNVDSYVRHITAWLERDTSVKAT